MVPRNGGNLAHGCLKRTELFCGWPETFFEALHLVIFPHFIL